MKKMMLWMMTALLMLSFAGCAGEPAETTAPTETTLPATEPVLEESTAPETAQPRTPDGYVSVNEIIEGTDLTLSMEETSIFLSEDGLTIELIRGSKVVCRNGYVMAVMKRAPIVEGECVFIHEDFYLDFLCKEDSDDISLFHGVFFFPEEILAVIDAPDGSVLHQKIIAEVLLPTSMDIEIPHVDMNRAFQYRPLSEYPAVLAQELEGMGYRNAGEYTYTEYAIISGSQTLVKAGFSAGSTGDIPFDPDMTVWEYHKLASQKSKQDYLELITEEQRAFAEEKNLEMDDMWHLQRVFDQVNWGDYMKETDETLRAALVEYYEADISYLRSMTEEKSE